MGSGRQNTKYKTGQISCFVFCILSLSIVVVDRIQNRLEICVFNFVAFFCRATKHEIETKFTHNFLFGPVLSRDKIQNTKHEIRPVLYFVFCRPLGTTSIQVNLKALKGGSKKWLETPKGERFLKRTRTLNSQRTRG